MFLTLWEFEVKPGSEELFEAAYGSQGAWAQLFRQDPGYRGTRLLREVGGVRTYVTMDSWESRESYDEFREKFALEYLEIDKACEAFTQRESLLASWQP